MISVSMDILGSNMILPLHRALEKYFKLGSCHELPSLNKKHGRMDVHVNTKVTPICKPYYQSFVTP
jgi:hypothetical protein